MMHIAGNVRSLLRGDELQEREEMSLSNVGHFSRLELFLPSVHEKRTEVQGRLQFGVSLFWRVQRLVYRTDV